MKRAAPANRAAPSSARVRGGGGLKPWGLRLICLVVMLGDGLAGYFFAVQPVLRSWEAASWPAVPCELLEAKVVTSSSSDGTTYRVAVRYAYHWPPESTDSQRYISTRYDVGPEVSSSGRSSKQREVDRLRSLDDLHCYVDPNNPSYAVLDRGTPLASLIIGLVTGVIFLAALTVFLFAGKICASRQKPQAQRQALPGGGEVVAHRAPGLPSFNPDDGSGRRELRPSASRWGRLLGSIVFTVFWNAVTWIIIIFAILPEFDGGSSWFILIFMSIFVVVGAGAALSVVYYALALTNPRWSLTVNRRWLSPGQTLEVAWECQGSPHRVREFSLVLEAVESATYRRGTKTHTDTHVCHRIPIFTANDAVDMRQGQQHLVIPQDAMYTVIANNNKITWRLQLHAKIPLWPDVKDPYEMVIAPESLLP